MAQHGGEALHIHAASQSDGGKRVPQIVETNLLTLGVFQDEVQPRSDVSRVQRGILFDRRGEHPPGVYALLVLVQNVQERRRQADRADGGLCFGLGDQEPVLLYPVDLLGDL